MGIEREGATVKQLAAGNGWSVQVRPFLGNKANDHRVIVTGNCDQCVCVQELLYSRLAEALRSEGQDLAGGTELLLLIREEAAGIVIGKRGFVLQQMRRQSGATIELYREEVQGQRHCIITGTLQNVIKAERHV